MKFIKVIKSAKAEGMKIAFDCTAGSLELNVLRDIKYDKEKSYLTTKVNAFVKTNYFGTYKNVREEVTETSFKLTEIARMLKKAGFKKVVMYRDDMKKYIFNYKRLEKNQRVYIVAKK